MKMISCNYAIKLDKTIPVIETVKNGETVQVSTVSAYGADFQNISELMDLIAGKYGNTHHHPLTGPIDIEGAKIGDVAKVTIHSIKINIMGQALSQSAGINPIKVNHFGDRAPVIAFHNGDEIDYMGGISIPYRPMIGMIGSAPQKDYIKTGHAGHTGGNLDLPFVCENAVIYIPIETDGGKLFFGDAHGSQGYGELGGVALEASSKIKMTIELLKPRHIFPCIVISGIEPFTNENALGIVGIANAYQNLNEAIMDAYNNTINILKPLFPTLNEHYICNFISAFGHSMNGQAFSKTSESTSMIALKESDLKKAMQSNRFTLKDFETIWFKNIL